MSDVLTRAKKRIYVTPERRETERHERFVVEERETRTFELTVWEKEGVELRPFSSEFQWSALTKTYRDIKTGRLTSKSEYGVRLKNWRMDMASAYISRAHPNWVEAEVVDALMRLEELRSEVEPDEWVDIEIGEIFSP